MIHGITAQSAAASIWTDDTFNPANAGSELTFADGNHSIQRQVNGFNGVNHGAVSLRSRNSGTAYFEVQCGVDFNGYSGHCGITDAAVVPNASGSGPQPTGIAVIIADADNGTAVLRLNGAGYLIPGGSYGNGTPVSFAVDFDTRKVWVRINNDWIKSDRSKTAIFDPLDPTGIMTDGPSNGVWRIYGESYFNGTWIFMQTIPTFTRTPVPGFNGY